MIGQNKLERFNLKNNSASLRKQADFVSDPIRVKKDLKMTQKIFLKCFERMERERAQKAILKRVKKLLKTA